MPPSYSQDDLDRFRATYGADASQVFGVVPLPPPVEGPMYNDLQSPNLMAGNNSIGMNFLPADYSQQKEMARVPEALPDFIPQPVGPPPPPQAASTEAPPAPLPPAGPPPPPPLRQPTAVTFDHPEAVPRPAAPNKPGWGRAKFMASTGLDQGEIDQAVARDERIGQLEEQRAAFANDAAAKQADMLAARAAKEASLADEARQRTEAAEGMYQKRMAEIEAKASEGPPPKGLVQNLGMALSFALGSMSDIFAAKAGQKGDAVSSVLANETEANERAYRRNMEKLQNMRLDATQRANMAAKFETDKAAADTRTLNAADTAFRAEMARAGNDPAKVDLLRELHAKEIGARKSALEQQIRAGAYAIEHPVARGLSFEQQMKLKEFGLKEKELGIKAQDAGTARSEKNQKRMEENFVPVGPNGEGVMMSKDAADKEKERIRVAQKAANLIKENEELINDVNSGVVNRSKEGWLDLVGGSDKLARIRSNQAQLKLVAAHEMMGTLSEGDKRNMEELFSGDPTAVGFKLDTYRKNSKRMLEQMQKHAEQGAALSGGVQGKRVYNEQTGEAEFVPKGVQSTRQVRLDPSPRLRKE